MKELGLLFGNTALAAATATPNHVLLHYAGNLTHLDDLFMEAPVNSDDLPIIENDRTQYYGSISSFNKLNILD